MQKEQLYQGKAKIIYATENPNEIIIAYKNDTTANNNLKKAQFDDKGKTNNLISTAIFEYLIEHQIPTHYIKTLSETQQLCRKVSIIPLEIIVRNKLAGSTARLLGIAEGTSIDNAPLVEICYKNDELKDPMINDQHAIALKLATQKELDEVYVLAKKINVLLIPLFARMNIELIDFKIEMGKDAEGEICLADEISPDTCRLWDKTTGQRLDKDVFRKDLGNMMDAYAEVLSRFQLK